MTTDSQGTFDDIPVGIGVVYEGERVRAQSMHAELGGPHIREKCELLRIKPPGQVKAGSVLLVGPDLTEMEPGSSHPLGIFIEVSGRQLDTDMEGVLERRIHDFCNWIEGVMHLNQRDSIWVRVDKRSVAKGLSLRHIGLVISRLYLSALPIIEDISITFITDPERIKEPYQESTRLYELRDARTRGMTDNDVEVFYGCSLCQSFAPAHVCIITPERYANCGAISWLDGKASARVDPKGPIYEIRKGTCLDEIAGEYEGVNQVVKEKSLNDVTRVQLYTAFGYPHTSCGCFECTTFYIPECDGLGIVHREYRGTTPTGLTFGMIAESTGGGRQVEGFHGLSFEYMRSPKFLIANGGWDRIVWMPSDIKERLKEYIPGDMYEGIASDRDAKTVDELMGFLQIHHHPVLERIKAPAPTGIVQTGDEEGKTAPSRSSGAGSRGGITVTFRNVSLYADRLFVRKGQP